MEVKQMMAQMLDKMKAEIRTNQDKMEANLKEIRAGQDQRQPRMDDSQDGCQISRNEGMAKRDVGLARSDGSLPGE
jgi:hypothetical protein